MSWNLHIDYICARANTRLHYLQKVKVGWPSCWPTYSLVYRCHPTSSWILCGCLAPWSFKASNRQTRSMQFRDVLFASFMRLQRLCLNGRHYILLGFRLFLTGAMRSAAISFRKCVTHPVVSEASERSEKCDGSMAHPLLSLSLPFLPPSPRLEVGPHKPIRGFGRAL